MKLGYWGIRGLGEFARLIAADLGLELTEENPQKPEDWFNGTKLTHIKNKVDFPNLPYLQDGDVIITESIAIDRYLAYKAKNKTYFGATEFEQI